MCWHFILLILFSFLLVFHASLFDVWRFLEVNFEYFKIFSDLKPRKCFEKKKKKKKKKKDNLWRNCQIIKGIHLKNLKATVLFVDFSKVFNSIHRGKISSIWSSQTVTAIMMLYKNVKAMGHSTNDDTNFFDIVYRFLQRYITTISIHNLPRLRTYNVNKSKKMHSHYKRQEASNIL